LNALRLFRAPGILTAWADIFTGYLLLRIAGIGQSSPTPLAFLLAATACLHLSGMIWNDLFDLKFDAKHMPDRPLPSGVVSVTHAFILGAILMIAGILISMVAGMYSFVAASALAALILSYHAGAKRIEAVGAIIYGCNRGVTLVLGMSVHSYISLIPQVPEIWLPTVLIAIYAAAFAVLLRQRGIVATGSVTSDEIETKDPRTDFEELPTMLEGEDETMRRNRAITAILQQRREKETQKPQHQHVSPEVEFRLSKFACSIIILCPLSAILLFPSNALSLSIFLALLALLGNSAFDVYTQSSPFSIRHFTGIAILGIVLLDAGIVASYGNKPFDKEVLASVLLILALGVPAWLLGKRTTV